MIGLALQVVVGYVTDAVLSLLPDAAADYNGGLSRKQAWATPAISPS
ncbi:MAG: hypothetical protein ACLRM9_07155 [Collinsella aerofaciens]